MQILNLPLYVLNPKIFPDNMAKKRSTSQPQQGIIQQIKHMITQVGGDRLWSFVCTTEEIFFDPIVE